MHKTCIWNKKWYKAQCRATRNPSLIFTFTCLDFRLSLHWNCDNDVRCRTAWSVSDIEYVTAGCDNPTLQPSDMCVPQGHTYTCTGTSGHPKPPSYTFNYWSQEGTPQSGLSQQIFQMTELGNFSLGCVATYAHEHCTNFLAECHANIDGAVIYSKYNCLR